MKKFISLLFLIPVLAFGADVQQATHAQLYVAYFNLYATDGTYDTDEADGGAETSVSCDGNAFSTATNDFVNETNGLYSITLTAAEMECKTVAVLVQPTSVDEIFIIQTRGDVDGYIQDAIASGTAQSATVSTLVMDSSEAFADDELIGTVVCTTGGTGRGQCRTVSDNAGSTDTLTISEDWTTTPSGTVTYTVLRANQATLASLGTYLDDTQGLPDITELQAEFTKITDGTDTVWVNGLTIATGICDTGSATTCVDSALTQTDAGYWALGTAIVFNDGTIAGQVRCITSFVPATDTAGFYPATTQAVVNNAYTLIAAPTCRNYP